MAIAFRSKASINYASDASPHLVGKPAGTVADDIMVAVMAIAIPAGKNAFPPDGSWTAVRAGTAVVGSGGFRVAFYAWWKRAGASEAAGYDFTSDAGGTPSIELVLASYSGCIATGSPIDSGISVNVANLTSNGLNATALSITTTVADAMLVIADHNWDAANLHVPPTGFTERHEYLVTINDAAQAVAGASGNKGPYASGTANVSDPWQSWMFALKPVATGGAASGKPKAYSGSAWVEKPAKVWSGSAWVQKPVKVWDGSVWKTVGASAGPSGPTTTILTSYTPGTDRNDFTGEVGVRLGIGGANIGPVTWVGARCNGYGGTRTVKCYEWFSGTVQWSAIIDYTGKTAGQYAWTAITPFTFLASGYYALLMVVTASDGMWWSNPGAVAYAASITNVYDSYYSGGLATGSVNSSFIGLDLGW